MLKTILTVVLPLAAPIALYAVYYYFARKAARAGAPPPLGRAWPWLALAGLGLAAAFVLLFLEDQPITTSARYTPPDYENYTPPPALNPMP